MRVKMKYREQRFECGEYLELNIFPVFECPKSYGRRKRRCPTAKVQEKLNQINREKEVNRVICANFTDEDVYLTLTYKTEPADLAENERHFRSFLGKINRKRKKKGLEKVKYVKTVEVGSRSGRIHMHLVMSGKGLTSKDIADCWKRGYIRTNPLQFDTDGCMGLSRYFTKAKTEGNDKQGTVRHSWSCSRNCIRPKPKTNDHKYSKREVRNMVEDDTAEAIIRRKHPDYLLTSCESVYRDETGLYYIYARLVKKTARLNI